MKNGPRGPPYKNWPPDKRLASGGRVGAKFLSGEDFFFQGPRGPGFLYKLALKKIKSMETLIKIMEKRTNNGAPWAVFIPKMFKIIKHATTC